MIIKDNSYKWDYYAIGGVVRVNINKGEDIAHLHELEQTKWTVLSCPVGGLEFDEKTLKLLDADGDGKIRVPEVIAAADWLSSVVRDKDLLLKGASSIPLGEIDTDNPEGRKLYDSAKQILSNLGLEKDEISIEDTSDSEAIFADTLFNGDGIVTAASTGDDVQLAKTIGDCIATIGSVKDRSGADGVNAALVETFYDACHDYCDWIDAGRADKSIFPYGDNTAAAFAAFNALKDKADDFFMRCKLIGFDAETKDAVDVNINRISEISAGNMAAQADRIADCPLARPNEKGNIPFDGINPAWHKEFSALKSLILDVDFKGAHEIGEKEWNAIRDKFGAYLAWMGAKKGEAVESLGYDSVAAIVKAARKDDLLALIEKDKALEEESKSIDAVDKLLHFYRDFYRFLRNYVSFSDFYGRGGKPKAIFEAGRLFIDERCCNLCIKVQGSGDHSVAAALGGMFLIYCTCTSKKSDRKMNIVAVMTDGDIKNIRQGKNAVFYDIEGDDWDAVVTKVVDNPISVRQAFWSPYRKLANFINDKIDKAAAEKDKAAVSELLDTAASDAAPAKVAETIKDKFDIAKFAGIFAAIGMAFGMLADAAVGLVKGVAKLNWWEDIIAIAAIMLVISGPACFIAWRKLRKRNLGPVLNANDWAINSTVPINIMFGGTLTSVARYPLVKGKDPFRKKPSTWKWTVALVAILAILFGILFLTHNLKFLGLS